jgi:hypothetical protein
MAPGQKDGWGNDNIVTVPSDVRFYIIDSDPATADSGGKPIVVPAKGSSGEGVGVVEVSVELQVRFVFNERVCEWYIKHGKRNEPLNYNGSAQEASGWQTFLNTSMNQKIIEAARIPVAPLSYIDAYVNAEINGERVFTTLANELSDGLTKELSADLGGQYFCGPSYQFDGEADGQIAEGDCPDLEVTVKRIVPVNPELIANLETIVKNEEAIRVIESNQAKELRDIAKAQQIELAETERQTATQKADAERKRQVETAQATANLEIAKAQAAVVAQLLDNAVLEAQADAAYCTQLAAAGIDCALLKAAETGSYPRILFGDSSEAPTLLLPTEGG